ncbi:GreA/GreB family elongation factor [Ectopseudomonas mendocina DLHK]|uniref:GreA/GreB family elongation factor n=1 Tax=Ectopseudomonas hydrolytica TaxID=2493633 RepID=UPI0002786B88|nr:GreA/GreB family elongation factor [Pseudomonas mendocina DLHK]
MNKTLLLQAVLSQLQADLEQANLAALSAHEAATHEENVAENKYDTLGLEAAYLASGQARRVEELRQTLITWRQLRPRPFDEAQGIELGALVLLAGEDGHEQWLFLGPQGASMKLQHAGRSIQVLGNAAPLGRLLQGKRPGDEINLPMGKRLQLFEVLAAE